MPRPTAQQWITIVATVTWTTLALVAATQHWATFRGGPKEVSWPVALAWHGSSFVLLIPLTPLLHAWIRRRPLSRRDPAGVAGHAAASIAFGAAFLLVSVPIRLAFHPSPARWSFFGEAIWKSIPQFALLGTGLYWLIVVVSSLIETRSRLYAAIRSADDSAAAPAAAPDDEPVSPSAIIGAAPTVVGLSTPAGLTRLRVAEIRWAEPAPAGARIHADSGAVLVRHTLTQLEQLLPGGAFVRTHRSVLANAARIRDLRGAASRDGIAVLDSGDELPVSRRRHADLAAALRSGDALPPSTTEPAPLGG